MTTSGKSKNIIKGLNQSKLQRFKTITFCGNYVNYIKKYSDFILSVPSSSTPVIQEVHKFNFLYICQKLDEKNLKKNIVKISLFYLKKKLRTCLIRPK